MATSGEQIKLTGLVAASSLAASQYKAVKLASTAGQVKLATATSDAVLGILQNDPAAGEPAVVAILGESRALFAASVTIGQRLTVNSTSLLTGTTGSGACIIGIAKTASSTAGNVGTVILVGSSRF